MKPFHLKASPAEMEAIAARLVPLHRIYLSLGLSLCSSSSLSADSQGEVTGRFVYRGNVQTITHVVKRMGLQWA